MRHRGPFLPDQIVTDSLGKPLFWPSLFRMWRRYIPFWTVVAALALIGCIIAGVM